MAAEILSEGLSAFDVVVTANTSVFKDGMDHLERFVHAGGGWLRRIQLSDKPLPAFFGAQPGPVGPDIELRVLDALAQAAQTGKTVVMYGLKNGNHK